jgi:hypothetical protein
MGPVGGSDDERRNRVEGRMSGKCVLCLGTLLGRYLHAHAQCLVDAIYFMRDGYEGASVSTAVVKRLAPVCYLCNENETTDQEHVYPKSIGGDPGWPNIAGGCWLCNSKKGTKVGISDEAEERWHQHQEVFRAAAARCVERGDLLYHDLVPIGGEFEEGGWRYELVEELAVDLEDLLYDDEEWEEREYDPEALAGEIIDSWLETPAGQEFELWDKRPPPTPEERVENMKALKKALKDLKKSSRRRKKG